MFPGIFSGAGASVIIPHKLLQQDIHLLRICLALRLFGKTLQLLGDFPRTSSSTPRSFSRVSYARGVRILR